jgi:AraC-like DNA-binding protein
MESLYLISTGLAGFFIIILLGKPAKMRHDLILIVWLGIILFHVLVSYWESRHPYTFLLEISSAMVFLHGPLLYLYTQAITSPGIRFQKSVLIHLIPFGVYLLLALPYIVKGTLAPVPATFRDALAMVKLAGVFFYGILILRARKRYILQAQHSLSSLDRVQLDWIRFLVYGVFLLACIGLISEGLKFMQWIETSYEDKTVNIALSILIIILGYYGFRQTAVFIPAPAKISLSVHTETEVPLPPVTGSKYQRSGLDAEKSKLLAQHLSAYMDGKKTFTDPELSLDILAEQMSVPSNHLSQVINEQFGQHFWDFVNEYRVKRIQEEIAKGTHHKLTLLAIALDAGFNSKASFNRAFKKFTGKTPTEYLKEKEQYR